MGFELVMCTSFIVHFLCSLSHSVSSVGGAGGSFELSES